MKILTETIWFVFDVRCPGILRYNIKSLSVLGFNNLRVYVLLGHITCVFILQRTLSKFEVI